MISKLKMLKIEETLKDFKCLVPRFNESKSDPILLKEFCSRNRNPLFDLTQTNYFKTGLKSEGLIKSGGKGVDDHYIQRVFSMKIIFEKLSENPNMDVEEFIFLMKKYSSTISLTKEEHSAATIYAKKVGKMNHLIYGEVGISVPGLEEYLVK